MLDIYYLCYYPFSKCVDQQMWTSSKAFILGMVSLFNKLGTDTINRIET